MTPESPKEPSKLIWLALGSYLVVNVAYFPLCHLLEPNASNPYYVRVGGGWQTSTILGPVILSIGLLVLFAVGALRLSLPQFAISVGLIVVIGVANYLVCMLIGALYA